MNRYTKSFALTFALYVVIFSSFVYSFEEKNTIHSTQKKSEQIVQFTIIHEPTPIVKKKEIQKVVEKKITKKIKPKELEKKKEKIVKKTDIHKISKTKQIVVKEQIKQNKSVQKNTINHQDILKKRKENQNQYYTQIKETINKNKSYPKMAIKRGIEGIVKIEFTISKNGELLSFHIIEGKRVFKKSIAEAVKNSFPLTPPKDLLTSNTSLSLKIDYKLF